MTARRQQPQETPPDLPAAKAFAHLSQQMEKLESLKTRSFQQAEAEESEWFQLTQRLILRSFGSASSNYRNFSSAQSAGEHYVFPGYDIFGGGGAVRVDEGGQNERNYRARLAQYESVLKSSIEELKLDLPEDGIKGVYEPGQEFEFYADIKSRVTLAEHELFIIDPYLGNDIFDAYALSIPRTVKFRLLGSSIPASVLGLGKKYASGGNFQFRSTNSIHDRVIFVDKRAWVCGQSLKDAAKKKPTYIVEIDEEFMRRIYEPIWDSSQPVL